MNEKENIDAKWLIFKSVDLILARRSQRLRRAGGHKRLLIMKYYILTISDNLNIVGSYPQISPSDENVFGSPFSNEEIIIGEMPQYIPRIVLRFNENAIITDLLSTFNPSFGLVINERIESIVSNLNLPNHKFYPIEVFWKDDLLKYNWFNFYNNLFEYIDFDKTVIEIFHKFSFKVLDTVLLESADNFKKIKSTLGLEKRIRLKDLYFNSSFPRYDIMVNNIIGYGNLISENLLKALQKNNITGYEASPYNVIKS